MPATLPVYQHPTLTVLVDDSDSFLRSLSFQLDPNMASCAFADTRAALEWLRRHAQTSHWPATQVVPSFDTNARPLEQCGIALDVNEIYRIAFRPERFMTPTVVVVDYSMPQMNGVEFCKNIAQLKCKKILFTGAADEKIAVDAFNRGLIDRYIKKSDDDALERLEQDITELQARYFAEQSDSLRDVLALNGYGFVYDAAFAHLMQDVARPLGIVEHYLYPNPSGLLLYDAAGVARLLVVETDASMRAHIEVARDNKAPPSLVAALEARKVVPFFRDGDGMYSEQVGDDWLRYCQGANVLQGAAQRYYWALFDVPPGFLPANPRPFADFLRDQASRRV